MNIGQSDCKILMRENVEDAEKDADALLRSKTPTGRLMR